MSVFIRMMMMSMIYKIPSCVQARSYQQWFSKSNLVSFSTSLQPTASWRINNSTIGIVGTFLLRNYLGGERCTTSVDTFSNIWKHPRCFLIIAPSCLEKWQRIAQPRCLLVLYYNIAPFVTSCARMDRETKDEAGSLRCPICETDVLALGAKQVLLCWHIY